MLNQVLLWHTSAIHWVRGRLPNRGEAGASLVEYALLLALIAVVAVGALVFLGHTVNNTLNSVANSINNSITNQP